MTLSDEVARAFFVGKTFPVALLLGGKEISGYRRGQATFRTVDGQIRALVDFGVLAAGGRFDAVALVIAGTLTDEQAFPEPFQLPPGTRFEHEMIVSG